MFQYTHRSKQLVIEAASASWPVHKRTVMRVVCIYRVDWLLCSVSCQTGWTCWTNWMTFWSGAVMPTVRGCWHVTQLVMSQTSTCCWLCCSSQHCSWSRVSHDISIVPWIILPHFCRPVTWPWSLQSLMCCTCSGILLPDHCIKYLWSWLCFSSSFRVWMLNKAPPVLGAFLMNKQGTRFPQCLDTNWVHVLWLAVFDLVASFKWWT